LSKRRLFVLLSLLDIDIALMRWLWRSAHRPRRDFWWPWFVYCVANSPPNSPHLLSKNPEDNWNAPQIFRDRPELEQALSLALSQALWGEDPEYVRESWRFHGVEVLV
jgi:hypothetical protein